MRRALLRKGDETTAGGRVLEGVENRCHRGIPIAFIGAAVWCPACQSQGVVGWKGPHRNATMTGKQQALDGDECICKCSPPPLCRASQDSAWHSWEGDEAGWAQADESAHRNTGSREAAYDERFCLYDGAGKPIPNTYYTVRDSLGAITHGVTDSQGYTTRHVSNGAQRVAIYLGHREQ